MYKLLVEHVKIHLGHNRVVVRLKDSLGAGVRKEKESVGGARREMAKVCASNFLI